MSELFGKGDLADQEVTLLPEKTALVPITAAVHPFKISREIKYVEAGKTIWEIVEELSMPEYKDSIIVTVNGEIIPPSEWETTIVFPDSMVVLRAIPQGNHKNLTKLALTLAVLVIAFAVVGPAAGALAPEGITVAGVTISSTAISALAASTFVALGQMAISALIPLSSIPGATPSFGLSGIQNQETQYGTVPRVYGRTLFTPPKAAHSYTVFENNHTYLYALFDLGPGPVAISDIKIGPTPIDNFREVQYESREGRNSDAPITLYTNAVTQLPLAHGLIALSDTATERTPVGKDHIEVDVTFPGGLAYIGGNGKISTQTVTVYITITDVVSHSIVQQGTHTIVQQTQSAVGETFRFNVPTGQYDVTVTRTSAPLDSFYGPSQAYWSALRSWGPLTEPLVPANHAQIAVKIKATEQLNGDISSLNCIAQAYVPVWNGSTITESLNTHPAWAALSVLTGTSNARALDTNRIDLDQLKYWADTYPTAEFNYVFSGRTTLWQALRTIGAAGRAIPVVRDGLYSYVFDYVQDTVVQMFGARTVTNFKATRSLFDEVQASAINYISETMGWQQHTIYVYAAGFNVDNVDGNKIGRIDLTGVTSDDWAFKIGSYFFAAAVERPTVYQFDVELDHLACNPGDRIYVQHDVISAGIASGRVNSITRDISGHVTGFSCDEHITGDGTSAYSAIFRTQTQGIYTRPLTAVSTTESGTFLLATPFDDTADPIHIDDFVGFVTVDNAILDAVVKTITPSADFKATIIALDYAPQIHNGDAVTPPPVINDRIKTFIHALPSSSVIIDSLIADENSAVQSGSGDLTPRIHGHYYIAADGLPPTQVDIQWQIDGDTGWQPIPSLPSSSREFYIPISYNSTGLTFNVRTRGNNALGTAPSDWSESAIVIATYTVAPLAPVLSVTPVVAGVTATITLPPTGNPPAEYRIYASTVADFTTSAKVGGGQSSPVKVSGLKPNVYFFWATLVSSSGVESAPSNMVSAIPFPVGYDDLKSDVTDFMSFLGDASRRHNTAIDLLSTALSTIGVGAQVDFTNLTNGYTSAITTVTGPSSSIVTSITTLQSALTGYLGANAVSTAVSSLQTQVTTNGTNITANSTAITGLQSALTGYLGANAVSTAVTSLQTQITANGTSITANSSSITSLQSALNGYTGANAVSTAISGLQTQVTANGTSITANSSSITSLQSALSGYTGANAVSTAISGLQTQVTANGSSISANSSAITAIQSALTGYTGANAVATAVSGLQTQITSNDSDITALSSSITGVSSQVGNFYATGLFRVNTRAGTVSADATIALEVAASSGGSSYGSAIYLSAMSGGTSRVTILANEFFLTDGSTNHSPFFYTGGSLYMDSAYIQTLVADKIVGGTLDVGVINAGTITTSHLHDNAATQQFAYTSGSSGVVASGSKVILGTDDLSTSFSGYVAIVQFVGSITRQGGHSPVLSVQIFRGDVSGGSQTAVGPAYQAGGSGIPLVQTVSAIAIDTIPGSNGYYGVKVTTDDGSTFTSNQAGLIVNVYKK